MKRTFPSPEACTLVGVDIKERLRTAMSDFDA